MCGRAGGVRGGAVAGRRARLRRAQTLRPALRGATSVWLAPCDVRTGLLRLRLGGDDQDKLVAELLNALLEVLWCAVAQCVLQ